VIHCFDGLIILLYEHPFTTSFWHPQMAWYECHRGMGLQTRLLI